MGLMQELIDDVVTDILSTAVEDYLAQNTTKLDLATVVRTHTVRHAMDNIASLGNDFDAWCQDAEHEAIILNDELGFAYESLYSLTLPVMNREMLEEMEYVWYLQTHGSNETDAIMTSLYDDPLNTTLEVLNQMYRDDFEEDLFVLRVEVETKLIALADAMSDLEDDLDFYADKTRMDYAFFTYVTSVYSFILFLFCISYIHVHN